MLREEGTLPHSLSFDLTSNTKFDQLRRQVEQLSMYKETHHICLIGLDSPQPAEDVLQTPKRKLAPKRRLTTKAGRKLTLRDFHEEVLSVIVEIFVQQGFSYISTLPGGFRQIHQIAGSFGFTLLDHDQ